MVVYVLYGGVGWKAWPISEGTWPTRDFVRINVVTGVSALQLMGVRE